MTNYKGKRTSSGYGQLRSGRKPPNHSGKKREPVFKMNMIEKNTYKVLDKTVFAKETETVHKCSHLPESINKEIKNSAEINLGNTPLSLGLSGSQESKKEVSFKKNKSTSRPKAKKRPFV